MNDMLEKIFNSKVLEEIQKSGVQGYCICCGAICYINSDVQEHDEECIWYE